MEWKSIYIYIYTDFSSVCFIAKLIKNPVGYGYKPGEKYHKLHVRAFNIIHMLLQHDQRKKNEIKCNSMNTISPLYTHTHTQSEVINIYFFFTVQFIYISAL